MNQDHSPESIQQAVLEKVRAGTIRRRPRSSFVLRVMATTIVGIVLLAISAYLISFIFFSLHESGEQFLLGYGLRGIEVFLTLFPWLFALLAIALLVLLEWLVRGFKFGYRIPLLNIFLGIIGVSLVLGVLISFTPLHTMLLGAADRDQLPVVGGAYRHVLDHHEAQGICQGTVVSIQSNGFTVQHDDHDRDSDDGTFTIRIAPGVGIQMPHVGDHVVVFGDPEQGYIQAEHVQMLPPSTMK